MGRGEEVPLIPGGAGPSSGGLFATVRPRRDVVWSWLWALALAACTAGGVYAWQHRNPDFGSLIAPSYLSDAAHCPAHGPHGRRLLLAEGEDAKPSYFVAAAGLCTSLSIAGGIGLALLSLLLFKRSPHGMVTASVVVQVAIPAAIAIAAWVSGSAGAAVPFALMAGLLGFTLWLYREQLALVARLLSVSVRAMTDQPGIVVAALGLQILGLLVLVPLVALMVIAAANGHVIPNPARARVDKEGACLAADGSEVVCCTWQVDSWVPGYLAYTALVATWTTLLVYTVKMFTIGGATAQWYFAPAGAAAPKGATLRSLRHALGPSFGTLALASWLLALIKYARAALDKIRQDNEGGFCAVILTSCLDFIYAVFEMITKFGVVRASITGEGFVDACHGAVDLLARNLLDTVGVWWLPGLILQTTALMMSLAWGLVTYGASSTYWGGGQAAVASGVVVGVMSTLFALICLSFINGVLLNVVDAAYIAWAMDKDAAAVTRSDVWAVFDTPAAPWHKAPGAVIEQPDDAYAYGAEAGGRGAYPPPMGYPAVSRA